MRIIKEYTIPILLLSFFIMMMLSAPYMKGPLGEDDHVIDIIGAIQQEVSLEEWDLAANHIKELEHAWKKVLFRIQISVDKDYLLGFEENLSYLKGAVYSQMKKPSLLYCKALSDSWDSLGD